MKRKLVDIEIEHVAAVDRPANKRSFLIIKAQKKGDKIKKDMPAPATFDQQLLMNQSEEILSDVSSQMSALYSTICGILCNAPDPSQVDLLIEQAIDAFAMSCKDELDEYFGADADDTAKSGRKISAARLERLKAAHAQLKAMHETVGTVIAEADPTYKNQQAQNGGLKKMLTKEQIAALAPEVRVEIEALQAAAEAATAEIETLKAAKPDEVPDIWKGVSKEVRDRFEALEKSNKEKDELLNKQLRDKEIAEWVVKAAQIPCLVGKPQDVGESLHALSKSDAAKADALLQTLKAQGEAVRQGRLFNAIGNDLPGDNEDSAIAKVNALATAEMKADPKLSNDSAIEKVMKAHPELYGKYTEESRVKA